MPVHTCVVECAWNGEYICHCVASFLRIYSTGIYVLVFTHMPGESYRRQFRSSLLCLCDVFQVLKLLCVLSLAGWTFHMWLLSFCLRKLDMLRYSAGLIADIGIVHWSKVWCSNGARFQKLANCSNFGKTCLKTQKGFQLSFFVFLFFSILLCPSGEIQVTLPGTTLQRQEQCYPFCHVTESIYWNCPFWIGYLCLPVVFAITGLFLTLMRWWSQLIWQAMIICLPFCRALHGR